MYTLLILSIMIFMPLPIMSKYMIAKKNPYRAVLQGILYSLVGIALVFIMVKIQTGSGIADLFHASFKQALEAQDPSTLLKAFGIENVSEKELIESMDNIAKLMEMMIPANLIVWSSIFAYVDYKIISRALVKNGIMVSVLPPLRELALPKNSLLGAIIICVLAYLSANIGIIDETTIMLNIQLVLNFVFAVQGLAVALYYAYVRRMPKFMVIIMCVFLLMFSFGRTLLFILGLTEIVLNLRKRFPQKHA